MNVIPCLLRFPVMDISPNWFLWNLFKNDVLMKLMTSLFLQPVYLDMILYERKQNENIKKNV